MAHRELVENVSQSFGRPESMPRLNQRTRCCDDPWVNDSGTTPPRGLLLQTVVADRRRRVERFGNVAGVQLVHVPRAESPHAGVAVRLQFHAHGGPVAFSLGGAPARRRTARAGAPAQQGLFPFRVVTDDDRVAPIRTGLPRALVLRLDHRVPGTMPSGSGVALHEHCLARSLPRALLDFIGAEDFAG